VEAFRTEQPEQYKKKALHWASLFDTVCYLDSSGYADPYSAFDVLIAAGSKSQIRATAGTAFQDLEKFLQNTSGYRLGFLPMISKMKRRSLSLKIRTIFISRACSFLNRSI
jgi:para-aminobenzoate synthetase component I